MKRISMKLMAVAFFCCSLLLMTMVVAANNLANDQKQAGKSKQKTVTLSEDVMVNDQLVRKGTYRVKFDAVKSQIVIINDDGDLVATSQVDVKMGTRRALNNSISSAPSPKGKVMTGLTFEGDRRVILLPSSADITAEEQEQEQ